MGAEHRTRIASAALTLTLGACAGRLEHPERFGIVVPDAGTPRDAGALGDAGSPGDAALEDAALDGAMPEDVPAMLAAACGASGCHGPEAPALGLDLVSPGLATRLGTATSTACMTRPLVSPSAPDDSLLLEKVRDASPACGARMPLGGAPFDAPRIAALRAWIAAL